MKKLRALGGALALAALLANPMASHAADHNARPAQVTPTYASQNIVLSVVEYPSHSPEKTTYLPGNTTTPGIGSYYVFDNPFYSSNNTTSPIGQSVGLCTYVDTTDANCAWSLVFNDGSQIEVQGTAPDTNHKYHTTYTVAGGTGKYSQAHGTMQSDRFSDNNHAAYQYTLNITVVNDANFAAHTTPSSH